ncbi:MAG: hypothetical protein ACK4TL_11465 [Hyphomicrobiaceae bacterium]
MKVKLVIRKKRAVLYDGVHEITDAESFGAAFAAVWARIEDRRLQKSTSIGELMEMMSESLLGDLNGAEILIEKA